MTAPTLVLAVAPVLVRCPGCRASVRTRPRVGHVVHLALEHADRCAWLRNRERGLPVDDLVLEAVR